MADLFSTLTDKAVLDVSQIELWKEGVILAAQESTNFYPGSPLISQVKDADTSVATFLKFAALSNGTSALTDGVEVTSESVTDSEVNITLAEYGNVVTTTSLGHIVTGGRLNPAVAELIGKNMGTSIDKLAIQTLEASTNELIVTQASEAALTSSDKMTTAYMEKAYNKLRRANIPKLLGDAYVAIMHPDVVSDLRNVASAGDWVDVLKYTTPDTVLRNEVGFFKGFRVIESSNITINTDAGAGAVDSYHSIFIGYNALGYGESTSRPPQVTAISETDKLNRFIHLGWYGVFAFGIIDSNAVWVVTSASSYGTNA